VFDTNSLSCVTKPSDGNTDNVTLLPDKLVDKETLSSFSSHNISDQDFDIGLIKCGKAKVLQMGDNYQVISSNNFLWRLYRKARPLENN
jgi:hypothetical protein